MALDGRLISEHFPYVPIRLFMHDRVVAVEALIDTGFDGDVLVPQSEASGWGVPDGEQEWTLADGSEVASAYYLAIGRIGELDSFDVLVSVLGDEPLVDRGVIDRFAVTFDHGRRVIFEP